MNAETSLSWEEAVQTLRDDPSATELVRACYYDDPLPEAALRYWHSTEWSSLRALLPKPPGAALDIGSGRGISAHAFARDGWMTTALEPDPSAVVGATAIRSLAQESGTTIEVIETWGEKLPFGDGSFDVVHCRAVLHHAHDLAQLCSEVHRVLKPGGIFIATREHVVSSHDQIPIFQNNHALHHLYGGEYAYLLKEYKAAIADSGLKITRVLNPMESDINLFPRSRLEVKRDWSRRLKLPIASLVPNFLLTLRGRWLDMPGRLYSFVSIKAKA